MPAIILLHRCSYKHTSIVMKVKKINCMNDKLVRQAGPLYTVIRLFFHKYLFITNASQRHLLKYIFVKNKYKNHVGTFLVVKYVQQQIQCIPKEMCEPHTTILHQHQPQLQLYGLCFTMIYGRDYTFNTQGFSRISARIYLFSAFSKLHVLLQCNMHDKD